MLRLVCDPRIRFLVRCSHSLSAMATMPDREMRIDTIESTEMYLNLEFGDQDDETLKANRLGWVRGCWENAVELMGSHADFRLAMEAFELSTFIPHHALTLVSLWGALEALFSPSTSELRFRVSVLIASYSYLWSTLGQPVRDLFAIPEHIEPDRRNLNAATFGVHVSAPRAVENFLDLGHFPYVHTNYLGVEPHTEVRPYQVETSEERREVLATGCIFYQPRASAISSHGFDVEYIYRVPHPYCAILYKANAKAPGRMDIIGMFAQPLEQEEIRAHMLLCMIDDVSTPAQLRVFQQIIFGQDKPILENQMPKRLPLNPRAEMPARADATSSAYRRWLSHLGVTYGTIPAEAHPETPRKDAHHVA